MRSRLIITLVVFLNTPSANEIEQFEESFDGSGPFESSDGLLGFDNAFWSIVGSGEFENGGLRFENFGRKPPEDSDGDRIFRSVDGTGSFTVQVELRDLFFGVGEFGEGNIVLDHHFTRVATGNSLAMSIFEEDSDETNWDLYVHVGRNVESFEVMAGPNPSLSIEFDEVLSEVKFWFDNDVSDNEFLRMFGPYAYEGIVSDSQLTRIQAAANFDAHADLTIDNWSLLREPGIPPGDFDRNSVVDTADIDLLTKAIQIGSDDQVYDLNNDKIIDEFDRNIWVKDLADTWFGDSNLDGEFNSSDLVAVFAAAEYDDQNELNSTWSTGDWNGDGEFNSRDLVIAFSDGGYEVGPRTASAVPEPGVKTVLLAIAVLSFIPRSRLCQVCPLFIIPKS